MHSIEQQSYTNYEIIAIDDGSTDNTSLMLKQYTGSLNKVTIIRSENKGQGAARNRGIDAAVGQYLLFLDVDDYLEEKCLERLHRAVDDTGAEVIHFGWKGYGGGVTDSYTPSNVFKDIKYLSGVDCEKLLITPNYFSVNNIYKSTLLVNQKIKFGEGYLYEDNEFIVSVAMNAEKISIIDDQLYFVQLSNLSSTRLTVKDIRQFKDFITAVDRCYLELTGRTKTSEAYLTSYFLEKFVIYLKERTPLRYKLYFMRSFLNMISASTNRVEPNSYTSATLRVCVHLNIFSKKKTTLFLLVVLYKVWFAPLNKSAQQLLTRRSTI